MTYGKCIKQARENRRLTQEQLAEQLDISRQAVSKWEADLSRPTREKLDRLSEILDIPPGTWAEIDAELAAAGRPPDTARPWKIASAALAAVCLVLAIALTAALWPRDGEAAPPGDASSPQETLPPEEDDEAAPPSADPSAVFPDTLPLTVRRDFDFGDQPLGEYDRAEIPFLSDWEQVVDSELWYDCFPDGTRLSLVPASASWDESGARTNVYLLYAPPVEVAGGELEYHILFRIGGDYTGTDRGSPEVAPFSNVLGQDGFRIDMSHADNYYRDSTYIIQGPDGTPRMMGISGGTAQEADVDEDGVKEIVYCEKNAPTWEITDTREGQEGAFTYTLSARSEDFPGAMNLCFDPEKGGFVAEGSDGAVLARYVLGDGEMVRRPLTDVSVLDYPDAAATRLTFMTDCGQIGILTDGLDPDEILPYSPDVRITHRQQAYLALQELYNLTGLTVEACYCAANEFGVHFSLLPDGFDQRGFFHFDLNTRWGNRDHIPSLYISWKELDSDWSPLSAADALRPGSWVEGEEETLLWYYDRMETFRTGEPSYANLGELWLENGDLYVYTLEETASGPVLTSMTGPYPGGEVNH